MRAFKIRERLFSFCSRTLHYLVEIQPRYRLSTSSPLAIYQMHPGNDMGSGKVSLKIEVRWGLLVDQRLPKSAGAGSAESHVLFPFPEPLFRAVISDSSTGPL